MSSYGVTNINPVALMATLAAGVFLLTARRSQAILAIALVACLIPVAQRVVVAGLDFNMIRILILFGWVRLLSRNEMRGLRMNEIDVAFVTWIVLSSVVYLLREETASAIPYRLGMLFDAAGVYFLFRILVNQPAGTVNVARYFAICVAMVMLPMTIEWATGRNAFAVFGGVPAITVVREGRLRCQGAFSHPIMVGDFGATLFPVFVGMYFSFARFRTIAVVGAVSALVVSILAASSGAVISLLTAVVSLCLWPLRRHTRAMRRGLLAVTIVLHFSRDKPVWQLIGRLSEMIGGEGYHRSALITNFVNHWSEWFLLGTSSTAHWGFLMSDTTNQFVDEGVTGGILALVAFVALMSFAFRGIGIAGEAGARFGRTPRAQSLWCWGIGCGLMAHTTAFISVSYWGQMRILLYLYFAFISAEYSFVREPQRRSAEPATPQGSPYGLTSASASR